MAVQVQQIKREISNVPLPVFLEGSLQLSKIAYSIFIQGNRFAIQNCTLHFESGRRARDVRHASAPIQSFSGQQFHLRLAALLPCVSSYLNLNSVSIEFDFMNPSASTRSNC